MSDQLLASRSPQNPDDVVAQEPAASGARVADVVDAARPAAREWARSTGVERSLALRSAAVRIADVADTLEELIVREVGKPRGEARGEVARALAIVEYYAQQALAPTGDVLPPSASRLLYTERRPHGVVGLITPWNFPAAIPLWKAMPALAAGNAVVLKPSTQALACARLLESLIAPALPAGTFQLVAGEAETGQALVDAVDALSFTGSTRVGRTIVTWATSRGIPVQAEMGGQNAAIVLPDAPLASTAAMLANAAMGYAGQKCTATSRVIAVGREEETIEALAAAVRDLRLGDPSDISTVVGPVISAAAVDGVQEAARAAEQAGGRALRTGRAPGFGFFAAPTVVAGLEPDHPVNQQETFGPIVSVLPAADVDEAAALANGVAQGLVTSIHGCDLDDIMRAVAQVDTGMVKVNAPTSGVDFYAPFGGAKDSSWGPREQGAAALDFYSHTRTVTLASVPRPF